ncbi:MAG: tRNA uridine-5-carboxymethylaminomethyl(34) synthesis GTPase MnmE [Alistipes sp.]|nr:tRNA uridine-5-carboxymethylaminomethyl(34) synthesis GTPase MnmE [Alistipes sp.]
MTTIPEHNDTIVAPATADGGAMCVIRISGDSAIEICDTMFRGRRQLAEAKTHTLHYGEIVDRSGCAVDDVVAAVFRAPHSYTGDDTVEISAHGSHYIVSRIIRLAISAGARMARAGEFTSRAFLAGRLDLSQAEAVADIIASDSQWSHAVAATQMRGGYSDMLRQLRDKLLRLTSLLELELDFSEEDVEFADRSELRDILVDVQHHTRNLTGSFALGNALKEGVGVAIVGRPNAGKSTLLNRLAGDDRAMVSDIAGTTRDTIEATANIDGVVFRFIDTAGLRITDDRLEQMGMERTRNTISKARIILHLTTPDDPSEEPISVAPSQQYIRLINKIDLQAGTADESRSDDNFTPPVCNRYDNDPATPTYDNSTDTAVPTQCVMRISAKCDIGIDALRRQLRSTIATDNVANGSIVVSNLRHYEALTRADESLSRALDALDNGLPADLLSEDIRQVLHALGEITGEITTDDILTSIFSKFCIGK